MQKTILSTLAVLSASLIFTGCATKTAKGKNFSGFLGDYSNLEPGKSPIDNKPILYWKSDVMLKGKYDSIIIDPVIFYPQLKADKDIDYPTLTKILKHINADLREEIGEEIKIVSQPGPKTARLRVAITSVQKGFSDYSWYSYTPITFAVTTAGEAAGMRDSSVTILVESELMDSESSAVLITSIRKDFGGDIGPNEKITFERVESVLDTWAHNVGEYIKQEF